MVWKSVWPLVLALVFFAVGYFYYTYAEKVGLPLYVPSNTLGVASSTAPAAQQPVQQPPVTFISLPIASITPSSVTVQLGFNQTKTFAITKDTKLYSTVPVGGVGAKFSDVKAGDVVNIYLEKDDPGTVDILSLMPASLADFSPRDKFGSLSGKITAVNGPVISVQPVEADSAPVEVTLDASTDVLRLVAEGQTSSGREGLAAGMQVVLFDLAVQNGGAVPETFWVISPQ